MGYGKFTASIQFLTETETMDQFLDFLSECEDVTVEYENQALDEKIVTANHPKFDGTIDKPSKHTLLYSRDKEMFEIVKDEEIRTLQIDEFYSSS